MGPIEAEAYLVLDSGEILCASCALKEYPDPDSETRVNTDGAYALLPQYYYDLDDLALGDSVICDNCGETIREYAFHIDHRTATALLNQLRDDGGFTYKVVDDGFGLPTEGYWVAGASQPFTVDIEFLATEYVEEGVDTIIDNDRPEFVGGWISNGIVYIEAVEWYKYREDAIEAGQLHNQKAIYDIANHCDIPL